MDRYYEIAGISYRVTGQPEAMLWDEGVLTAYKTENISYTRCIDLEITEVLCPPEGKLVFSDEYRQVYLCEDGTYIRYEGAIDADPYKAYMRIKRTDGISEVQIKSQCLGNKSVLTAMELEHFATENKGVLFHACVVCIQDKALIFTAPSGIGKSTQAELWCKERGAELINGDRCIIRYIDTSYYISGVPYCGSSGVRKNRTLPLCAVVYLTQAPSSSAHTVKGVNAFMHLWEGCCINTYNSSDVEKCVEIVTGISENVPIVRLDCTPDITAVCALEKLLRELDVIDK